MADGRRGKIERARSGRGPDRRRKPETRALPGSILSSLGVGTVVRSLHQLTGQGHAPGDDYLELLGVHLDTIRAVLSAEKRSDGGKVGRELVRGLHRANRKFLRAPEHGQSPSGGRRACAQPVARTGALRTATVRRDGTRDWEI